MASLLLAVIYLAFISLGLPDSLLGAAWPVLHREVAVPLSWSGILFMIISGGTVLSALCCDRLIRRLGTGRVTALSVALTCAALFGFSFSRSFAALCLCAVPYGLGAGGVDAALNNYVAVHYASRHMSWLHCMWGVGASLGPAIMHAALRQRGWGAGYRTIGWMQLVLTGLLLLSLPLWRRNGGGEKDPGVGSRPLRLREIPALPGAGDVMIYFFCYCALEQTVGLWASSYLVRVRGVDAVAAAGFGSLFFLGITAGRALNGFLTLRWSDGTLIRLGQGVLLLGLLLVLLSPRPDGSLAGFLLLGLGCAPIYPCVIHSIPSLFGPERSQAVIGVQMANAYIGMTLMPPFFGFLAGRWGLGLLPFYLLILLAVMVLSYERLCRRKGAPA